MLPRQHAYLFWPIYQSFHDFHLTSARMLPRQHAYYFFLAYLAVFLWFWASQAGISKIYACCRGSMRRKTTTLTVLPVHCTSLLPISHSAQNTFIIRCLVHCIRTAATFFHYQGQKSGEPNIFRMLFSIKN